MNLYNQLLQSRKKYSQILTISKKNPVMKVKGRLEVRKLKNNKCKFYHIKYSNGVRQSKYINTKKSSLANKLATRDYNIELIELSKKRINQFDEILKDYRDNEIEQIYKKRDNEIKALTSPIIPTYEMQLQEFKDKPRTYLDLYNHAKKFLTKNGEYVRSKSEKIIADLLYDYGLAYVYEARISFEYQSYYPDFTVFHPIKRTEIYWEHFGMLSDFEYNANTYKKIMNYELNGYLTNDRLIVTMEFQNDLNIEWVKMLIENVLLK